VPVLQYQVAGPERLWPVELARTIAVGGVRGALRCCTLRSALAVAPARGVGRAMRGAAPRVKSVIAPPGPGRSAAAAETVRVGRAVGPGGSTMAWKSAG